MARMGTVWFADDDKIFRTEEAANQHDRYLGVRSDLVVFLDSLEPLPRGQRTRAEFWVKQWLAYNGQLTLDLDPDGEVVAGGGEDDPAATE